MTDFSRIGKETLHVGQQPYQYYPLHALSQLGFDVQRLPYSILFSWKPRCASATVWRSPMSISRHWPAGMTRRWPAGKSRSCRPGSSCRTFTGVRPSRIWPPCAPGWRSRAVIRQSQPADPG